MENVDQRLVELCKRDELIALRDRAKRAAEQGDKQAEFVRVWMEQELRRQGQVGQNNENTQVIPDHAAVTKSTTAGPPNAA